MLSITGEKLEPVDINNFFSKDNVDNEIFIFDDIRDLSLPENPIKLQMPIFVLCTQGWGKIKVNLEVMEVKENMIMILMPAHIIEGYSISDDFKALFLGIAPNCYQDVVPDLHSLLPFVLNFKRSPMITINDEEVASLRRSHSFIWDKMREPKGHYTKKMINSLLRALLYETLNIFRNHNVEAPMRRSRNDELLVNFFNLVERHYMKARSVAFYGEQLCVSPKYLSAVLKSLTGRTASDWIDNYVILTAKVLLRSSSDSIKEISDQLGFANQSFFGKYFKHNVGMSPQRYRSGNQ